MDNSNIEQVIQSLPKKLAKQLLNQQQMSKKLTFFSAKDTHKWLSELKINLNEWAQLLLPLATNFAETPISNFHVGAVAIDTEGNTFLGANFEFSGVSIGNTLHAEQSAIAHAWNYQLISGKTTKLKLLAINYPPCGHCRQFINEVSLFKDFAILLPKQQPMPLSAFLPKAFGPANLSINTRILNKPTKLVNDDSPLLAAAKTACINAHAPYSNNACGIALSYTDNTIVTGSYGENAAFNPSLPPLQMALNYRRLAGKDWHTIEHAIMVELATTASQKQNAEQLLRILGEIKLDYLKIRDIKKIR